MLRRAAVYQHGELAGYLSETEAGWKFGYLSSYGGVAVSLTLPLCSEPYLFETFPPVFEGLLPEGPQLEVLLRKHKIDRSDSFGQLIVVGGDLVGSLTATEVTEEVIDLVS